MGAGALETILGTWACFKWAQGVLGGTVTTQHRLPLSKGCLCVRGPSPGHPGASAQPSCPALFYAGVSSFPSPGPTADSVL